MQMETTEKMVWVGLDVSKATFWAAIDLLDEAGNRKAIHSLPNKEFKRTEVGVGSFLKWVKDFIPEDQFSIVMESTGCYSIQLAKWLRGKDSLQSISIQNGRLTSNFIKSLSFPHKTDKTDAQAIARFGTERTPSPTIAKEANQERLQELSRERSALVKSKSALESRRDSLFDSFSRKINGRAIAALTTQITALEKEIERCIKKNPELEHEAKLMISVHGVGKTSAYGISAELGSLKLYSRKELSAHSGLTPRILSSGSSLLKSHLSKRGSARVRQLLYLDCMQAVEAVPELNALYQRLVANGKSKMTARCACMRKLLLLLRSLVVNDHPYVEKISEIQKKSLDF